MKKQRDLTIELYRVLMMFGIVLFHAVNSCGHQDFRLSSNLTACVDAFALISGYFGIRFSWIKTLRLWGLAAFISLIVSAVEILATDAVSPFSLFAWLTSALKVFGSYWFLHAYVLMSFFSPFINNAFAVIHERSSRREAILMALPFLLAVFVWGFLGEYHKRFPLWPQTPGLEAFSGLTLIGVYIMGRLMRLFDIFRAVKIWHWVIVFILCLVLNPARFGFYNSPVVLALTFSSFYLFRSIFSTKSFAGSLFLSYALRFFSLLAPSMFAVYLLHTNPFALRLMAQLENALLARSCPMLVTYLLTALLAFVLAISSIFFAAQRSSHLAYAQKAPSPNF